MFQEAFAVDLVLHTSKVLDNIVEHPDIEVDMIKEYCTEFELDVNNALLAFLQATLLMVNADSDEAAISKCLRKAASVVVSESHNDKLLQLYQAILTMVSYFSCTLPK